MRLQVQSLVWLRGLRIWHCHELWYRSQMGSCRPGATALIRPQTWEPPCAVIVTQEKGKKKKKNKLKKNESDGSSEGQSPLLDTVS